MASFLVEMYPFLSPISDHEEKGGEERKPFKEYWDMVRPGRWHHIPESPVAEEKNNLCDPSVNYFFDMKPAPARA